MIKLLWNIAEILNIILGVIIFSVSCLLNENIYNYQFKTTCLICSLLMLLIGFILDKSKAYFA